MDNYSKMAGRVGRLGRLIPHEPMQPPLTADDPAIRNPTLANAGIRTIREHFEWRCAHCRFRQPAETQVAYIPDGICPGVPWEVLIRSARSWNKHTSGWCMDCASKLLPSAKAAPTEEPASAEPARLTRAQRASDAVAEFCGSWTFIIAFAVFTVAWIGLNTAQLIFQPFDHYPFILLNLVFTVVELFQGPLIMMSQNRQMERDRDAVRGIHAKLDQIILGRQSQEKGEEGK